MNTTSTSRRRFHRAWQLPLTAVITGALMLVATGGAANAAPAAGPITTSASDAVATTFNTTQVEQGTTADRVQKAKTLTEAIGILESEGFQQSSDRGDGYLRFEQTVNGLVIGFRLPSQESPQSRTAWGWNWGNGGPYLKGTTGEWRALLTSGPIVGSAACTFIIATVGAAACDAAAGLAGQWTNSPNTNLPAGWCLAIAPTSGTSWLENC